MPALPLKGIVVTLLAGGAILGVTTIPQLVNGSGKEVIPRLILGKGNNGKELYIRLVDLKAQGELEKEEEEDEDEEEDSENFTATNLWLDNVRLDLRGGKHSLESPNKDGKYYLLETVGNKKFLGGKEIPNNDTRSSTLQHYAKNNPNYIQLEESQWIGFTKYDKSNIHLEKIQSCVYSITEEGEISPIFVVCSPHQDTGLWNYVGAQYIARSFERKEVVK